jgi:isoleucyl-tRNA synthetase
MGVVREIVSLGLKERDKSGIGLKWPLSRADVYGKEIKFDEEFIEIMKDQLNVKGISFKESDKFDVKLDTKLTPDLEAEGYAREMSRMVQAFRKDLGLNKKDNIKLYIQTDGEFKKVLESQKDFIKERTNSDKIEIVTTIQKENFKKSTDFKVKDKRGLIGIITTER